MTDHDLEWLSCLIIAPRRLWRRHLIGDPLFLWRVLKQQLALRRTKRPKPKGLGLLRFDGR